jgi:hypothetical protein
LIRVIEEETIEAFFNWLNLLAKYLYYVKETWIDFEAGEQLSKMLFAYFKTTPCIALVQETVRHSATVT